MTRRAAALTLAGGVLVSAGTLFSCQASGDGAGAAPAGALTEEPCVGIPIAEARCSASRSPRIRPRAAAASFPSASSCFQLPERIEPRTRSSIWPAALDKRRLSSSPTRHWPQTRCARGAMSSSPTSEAPAARIRSSVSFTVPPICRRPTSTPFSQSRRCGRVERGSRRRPTSRSHHERVGRRP